MRAEQIIEAARGWVGTPFHHQASLRGVGADCLGLVIGVLREVVGRDVKPPAYARRPDENQLTAGLAEVFARVPRDSLRPGDVLQFAIAGRAVHLGIYAGERFVHALDGVGVVEVTFSGAWPRRVVAVWRLTDEC